MLVSAKNMYDAMLRMPGSPTYYVPIHSNLISASSYNLPRLTQFPNKMFIIGMFTALSIAAALKG